MRLRDLELDRLRARLAHLTAKEQDSAGRWSHALALWRAGAVVGYSPSSGVSNIAPTVVGGANGKNGSTVAGRGSGGDGSGGGAVTVTVGREEVNAVELIEALDRAREVSGADRGRAFEWG